MNEAGFTVSHLSEIGPIDPNPFVEGEWRPVRHHFGVHAFGTNAYTGEPGQIVIENHDETTETGGHQELYFVHAGRARFTLGDETVDAPAGTFVYIRDPSVRRVAIAEESGTTVFAFGAEPGVPFTVSEWERRTHKKREAG